MYRPPFTSFKRPISDPLRPGTNMRHGNPSPVSPGSHQIDCPMVSRSGQGPVKQAPRIQLVDHRKLRLKAPDKDRAKDIVETPVSTMSSQADQSNPEFQETLETAKDHVFWVFPEECTSVFMDKRTGLAYANVCLIGINGRQWPLFPGNNRAPGFVYEALETHREMNRRFKEKLAPPKASGRSVSFSDPRSAMSRQAGKMMTNPNLFNDSMLGKPNSYDSNENTNAQNLIHKHREMLKKQQERGSQHAR